MKRLQKIFIPLIQNRLLAHQHTTIFTNFKILLNVLQNHIHTEDSLVKDDFTHRNKHKEFLHRIRQLEIEMKEHIHLYDSKMHKL